MYRVIIIGAGPAGITAGIYLKRANIDTLILENGESSLEKTDAIDTLNQTQRVFAREFKGTRYDVGDKFGFLKTSIKYGLTHPEVKDNLRQYIIDLAHELESKKEEK